MFFSLSSSVEILEESSRILGIPERDLISDFTVRDPTWTRDAATTEALSNRVFPKIACALLLVLAQTVIARLTPLTTKMVNDGEPGVLPKSVITTLRRQRPVVIASPFDIGAIARNDTVATRTSVRHTGGASPLTLA